MSNNEHFTAVGIHAFRDKWVPVTTAWHALRLRMEERPPIWRVIIIGIQPLGRSGQRPDFSQVTDMALVRCILGKFLGVACHCFPPYGG